MESIIIGSSLLQALVNISPDINSNKSVLSGGSCQVLNPHFEAVMVENVTFWQIPFSINPSNQRRQDT
jgi:hypothetical protein